MAAIPTYVYLGDEQIDGGPQNAFLARPKTEGADGNGFYGGLVGLGLSMDQFGRAVPYSILTQTPGNKAASPAHLPYWDGLIETTTTDEGLADSATITSLTVTRITGATATGGTSVTIVDAGAGWTVNEHRGKVVVITAGTGVSATEKTVVSNTADTITVSSAFAATPDATSVFDVFYAADAHLGKFLVITSGTGNGANKIPILSNDDETFTVASWPNGTPDATSKFKIVGGWVVYHHTDSSDLVGMPYPLFNVSYGAGGDRWYEAAGERGGITPNTMLINAWNDNHLAAPYFKGFKYAVNGAGFSGGWDSTTWTAAMAEFDAATLSVTDDGDTLDVQQVILDASFSDIAGAVSATVAGVASIASTYGVALQATITAARAKFPTAHIQVVNHHQDIYNEGAPSSALYIRQATQLVVAENDNCSVFDMGWAQFGPEVPIAPHWFGATIPATERQQRYRTVDYVDAGVRLYNAWQAAIATAPSADPGSAIETYIIIGDSQMVGTVGAAFAYNDGVASILGEGPAGYVRAGEYVYNGSANEVQLYDVSSNPNTLGTVAAGTFGPEITLLKRAGDNNDDAGVMVWKFAKSGCSLTTAATLAAGPTSLGAFNQDAGTLWDQMVTAWSLCKIACPTSLNRVMDVRGILIGLGDNDTFDAASALEFATAAPDFVDDVRALFKTRIDEDPAVVWLQPPIHLNSEGQSQLGTVTARASVLATVASLATSKSRLTVLAADNARYELKRQEWVHYGGEAIYNIGYDAADAFAVINSGEAAAASTEDTPSGAASFTVETGSGAADSNSYCSVATADTFHQQQGNPSAWSTSTTIEKQDYLRRATLALDLTYDWAGMAVTSTQALAWPRYYVVDRAGYLIDSDEIPTQLQQATAMLALQIALGNIVLQTTETSADVSSETHTVGPVSTSTTYLGGKPTFTQYPAVSRMLARAGLIDWSGVGWGISAL